MRSRKWSWMRRRARPRKPNKLLLGGTCFRTSDLLVDSPPRDVGHAEACPSEQNLLASNCESAPGWLGIRAEGRLGNRRRPLGIIRERAGSALANGMRNHVRARLNLDRRANWRRPIASQGANTIGRLHRYRVSARSAKLVRSQAPGWYGC